MCFLIVAVVVSNGCSRRPQRNAVSVVEVAASATSHSTVAAVQITDSDWPQWRGPRGDGTVIDQDIPVNWDEATNVAWKVDVPGRGHASPILIGSLVCLATALPDHQQQVVLAFDRVTGEQRWRAVVHEGGFPANSEVHQKGSFANSTLASDGHRVFAIFFNSGKVFATAIDLHGQQVWQKEVGAFSSKFGYAPSPVIYKSTIIISADNWGNGYFAALNRETGDILWRKKRPAVSTYSSPLLATIQGRDQLVLSGCDQLVSYNPANGEQLWSCQAMAEATCGTPVTNGTYIFASGGYPGKQTVAVNGSGEIMWKNQTKVYEPSLVTTGGYVFAVTDDGIAWCWSADSGAVLWKHRLDGSYSASPVACNGHIFVPNLSGETIVFEAKGDAYHEVARNRLGQDSYACLAVGGNSIFMRVGYVAGHERNEKLVCLRKP